ncbi:MAG: ATP-binding protein [Micrococcales bacterium]|nr:ATP-binding protein [Micrococcales bacterium]
MATPLDLDLATEASEVVPDGLVAFGPDWVVLYANAAAARITGVPVTALLGHDVREALPLLTRDGSLWWDIARPLESLHITTGHRERLLMLPGGREVLLTAKYLRRQRRGPVERVVLALRDAETRRRADRDHAALISTVAHELRSPLTSVKGFSSTLLRRWDRFTDEQKRLMVETIEADADRLTRLITELLDVSRIDSGRLSIYRQPLELADVIRRHVDAQVACGIPEDRFRVQIEPGMPPLWADADRFDQILANLIENALTHGRGLVTVAVDRLHPEPTGVWHPDGTQCHGVRIVVTDEGPGIAPADRALVFSRFWQGSEHGSTGLGLYIVKGLVEAHGGTVRIGEAPGGGAQFTVALSCSPGGEHGSH